MAGRSECDAADVLQMPYQTWLAHQVRFADILPQFRPGVEGGDFGTRYEYVPPEPVITCRYCDRRYRGVSGDECPGCSGTT